MPWFAVEGEALTEVEIRGAVVRLVEEARKRVLAGKKRDLKRVLLLPPDITRTHSAPGGLPSAL